MVDWEKHYQNVNFCLKEIEIGGSASLKKIISNNLYAQIESNLELEVHKFVNCVLQIRPFEDPYLKLHKTHIFWQIVMHYRQLRKKHQEHSKFPLQIVQTLSMQYVLPSAQE